MAQIMVQYGRSSRSYLNDICTAHPLAGLLWERQFEKVLLKYGREKVPTWECLFGNREKGLFLSVYVADVKLSGKTHIILPNVEHTHERR